MENELIHSELPDIVQILQTINRREIRPDQVDWVKYLSEVVALRRALNKSATDIQMLWMFAAEVDDFGICAALDASVSYAVACDSRSLVGLDLF